MKIISPTWNDEFELRDGSFSASIIEDYIKYIIRLYQVFFNTKKLTDKTKNGENLSSLEVFEVGLVQCNLVDNQYQKKP